MAKILARWRLLLLAVGFVLLIALPSQPVALGFMILLLGFFLEIVFRSTTA